MNQRFSRTALLFGNNALDRLHAARVAVCGLGGVGSYAVEALVRSGVGYIRIIDFDTIKLSNCNRQLLALDSTIGKFKVDIEAERISQINPMCEVDKRYDFIDEKNADSLVDSIDYLVDAIDSVSSKVSLLSHCAAHNVGTVTCMGVANRTDPSMLRVGDISESRNCPLAKIIRKRIHRRNIYEGIRCVYSLEPVTVLLSEEYDKDETFTRGRERTPLGSAAYMTGIAGLMAAGEIIRMILNNGDTNDSVNNTGLPLVSNDC